MALSFPSSITHIFFSLGLLGHLPFASVASAAGLELAPMYQEVVLEEGMTETLVEVTLTNTTSTSMTFQVSVYDFESLDASGGIAFLGTQAEPGRSYALAPWITLEQSAITLEPGISRSVKGVIKNDELLTPGGHYGAMVFESKGSVESDQANGIAVEQRLASLLLVKKQAGANPNMELRFQSKNRVILPPKVALTVKSTGNVHVVPRGVVRILDPTGKVTSKSIINEASTVVLPGGERQFPITFFDERQAWLPGWYTLEILHRFDGKVEAEILNQRFFFIPWKSLIALLGFGGLWMVWRRFCRWRQERNRVKA